MPTVRALLVATGALALVVAASPARSLTAQQYLALRRQNRWDSRVTLALCEAHPTQAQGRVVELAGTVNGTITRESGLAFLLSTDDRRSLLLTAPPRDVSVVSAVQSQRIRVLARVGPPLAGTVGTLDLQPLGLAYDGEVSAAEREAAAAQPAAGAASPPAAGQTPRVYVSPPSRGGRPQAGASRSGSLPAAGLTAMARRYLSGAAQAIYPHYRSFIGRHNRNLTQGELDQITVSLLYYSERHKVDPRLVVAMIIAESDFRPRTTSHKGAMGLGQIMPDEARSHGLTDPYDPIQNIRASVNLLRMKLNLYWEPGSREGQYTDNQIIKALAAYNAGAGAVRKYGGVPPYRETQGYVKRIIKLYRELCGI